MSDDDERAHRRDARVTRARHERVTTTSARARAAARGSFLRCIRPVARPTAREQLIYS